MELKRLKYFIAVAEDLHFGRAAARLEMAQPPLSRQIAALERDLDAKLFDRSRSQIRLTPAGEVFLERARDLVDRLDSAYREARLIGHGGAGRLRIAFVGSATHGPLPTLIKSYRSHYPGVDLSLAAMNNAELERALVQQDIDIAVARPALKGQDLRSVLLTDEPLVLALPDNSSLATRSAAVALSELESQTFVLYPRRPRPSFADDVLRCCEMNGFTPRDQAFAQDYQTAISLVSVGVGLSVVPRSVSQVSRPGVTFRPFTGENPGTRLTIHARLDNRRPHLLNFFEILRRFVHQRDR
ncbi:LysR substrate-binding domain-containing protein [Celeribacter indicus]|uniref:LysR family transcriptional regulator n=1 Tax=Celeribacter indicus TaxID=1208324 RepID=A0A0B5DQN0_9RHOB|nr:LysR substrate-binding domain-containing protein [Celeribacter indicus]AJE45833.1 LysR family transcriptional regulator [Celeribacter indicus]SDW61749.1 DNA-binding transcriptional regulator, LysR family [Celeribacter indicus]